MKKQKTLGVISFSVSVLFTCIWAFWGIIENFHEGWYFQSFWKNIGLMFIQYLSPMIIFLSLTLISIWNNRVGAFLFFLLGIIVSYFANRFNLFVMLPFFIIAVMFWFSRISNKKLKYKLAIYLPLITLLIFSIEPIYRVSGRHNDGNFGTRVIDTNGVALVWAPRGPGWPDKGMNWYEADSVCSRLTEDGLSVSSTLQNIWRLPTVEEAVRSMYRNGKNCKGRLDEEGNPEYEITPDKETPLWNPNTMVIYWWTKTEIDSTHAYIIAYNGKIWKRNKNFGPDYLGFRAVKELKTTN
jgi:hypothetical protein